MGHVGGPSLSRQVDQFTLVLLSTQYIIVVNLLELVDSFMVARWLRQMLPPYEVSMYNAHAVPAKSFSIPGLRCHQPGRNNAQTPFQAGSEIMSVKTRKVCGSRTTRCDVSAQGIQAFVVETIETT